MKNWRFIFFWGGGVNHFSFSRSVFRSHGWLLLPNLMVGHVTLLHESIKIESKTEVIERKKLSKDHHEGLSFCMVMKGCSFADKVGLCCGVLRAIR